MLMGTGESPGVHHSAGKVPAFVLFRMEKKRVLKLFLDESGDPGIFSHHSPIYVLGFAVLEPDKDISEQERRFKEKVSRIDGGEYFVHTGNLIRNEKPYQGVSPENRRKLFWSLFFFAVHAPISLFAVHCRKDGIEIDNPVTELHIRLARELRGWCLKNIDYLKSFDSVLIYYDHGQSLIEPLVTGVFVGLGIDIGFIDCKQEETLLLQVADLACEVELVQFKYKEGSFTHSEQEFFGERGKIKKDLLVPLRKKFL